MKNITSKISGRQFSNLAKVEESEPDKLYKIVELELKGHDPAVLKSFVKFAATAGNHLNIQSKKYEVFI